MRSPVSFNAPVEGSRSSTSMKLSSRHATSIYLPLGVMMKLRGCLPVLRYFVLVSVPSSAMANTEMPSFWRRCDV